MTAQYQGIRVSRGSIPVADADVRVNGVSIPYYGGDLYSGKLPVAVAAGGTLSVKVTAGGQDFEGSGEVIPVPAITAPTAGSTFAWTDSISLAWSTPTDPDRFEVCLNCWDDSLDGAIYPAPGNSREFKIKPGSLVDYGGGAIVAVYAYKSGFLKSVSSTDATSSVLFMARSPDARIPIRH